jgi:pyruvate dehydrogenase E1 component alpha subunit/2-oxoisovalerate dehydrogenase E1 component alpha subunit
MSSCIATQLPHATGMALAARIGRTRGDDCVVLGYLGDGATSEADFHVALNFAGVFRAPVVFVCQNNQWGISTPVSVQSASPTLAVKAHAYGMPGVRVDGNDVIAVYATVAEAVDRARRGGGPTLIEALTYRVGPHSTSDDPSRYRDENITREWVERRDPIARFKRWLTAQGHLTEERDAALRAAIDADVREAIAAEEHVAPVALHTLIEQVFAEVPSFLEEELAEIADLPRQKLGGVHQ